MRKDTMLNFSQTALWLGSLRSKGSERSSPNRAFSLSMEAAIKKLIEQKKVLYSRRFGKIDIWDSIMAAALTSRKKINKLLKEVHAFLSFFARDL